MSAEILACADQVLVEALHDGRLGERERASIERHLATCASCRAHLAFLRDLGPALRADDEAPSELAQQRARRLLLRDAARPAPVASPRRRVVATSLAVAATLAASLSWALLSGSGERGPSAPTSASAASASAGALPAPSRARGDAVEASPVPPLPAGPSASIPSSPAPSAEARPAASAAAAPSVAALSSPRPPRPPPGATSAARDPRSSIALPAPSAAPSGPAPESSASRAFAAAVAAVGRGEYEGAAGDLERFSTEHPDDARVDESDYLIAIALERAGRHDDAAKAAQRYLERHPRGSHRPEAELIAHRSSPR